MADLADTKRSRKLFLLPAGGFAALCLTAAVIVWSEKLPMYDELKPVLASIGGFLLLIALLLFSFWFAARNTRATRVMAVGLRIIVGAVLFLMACRIWRDIEIRHVDADTWVTGAILILTILIRFSPRIIAAVRLKKSIRRATATTAGRIEQIIGETQLDRNEESATIYYVRVLYTVGGTEYELRADIAPQTFRKYGRDAFIGLEVPVWYDPANPAVSFTTRIDKQLLEVPQE